MRYQAARRTLTSPCILHAELCRMCGTWSTRYAIVFLMQSGPVPPSVLPDIQHTLQATKRISLTTQYNSANLLKMTPTRNSVTLFPMMKVTGMEGQYCTTDLTIWDSWKRVWLNPVKCCPNMFCECTGEHKNLLLLPGNEPQFHDYPAHNIVTVWTMLTENLCNSNL